MPTYARGQIVVEDMVGVFKWIGRGGDSARTARRDSGSPGPDHSKSAAGLARSPRCPAPCQQDRTNRSTSHVK